VTEEKSKQIWSDMKKQGEEGSKKLGHLTLLGKVGPLMQPLTLRLQEDYDAMGSK